VDEEIKKGASFQSEKKHGGLTRGRQKRKDAPVPENKVISLEERAKDEQSEALTAILGEGASGLSATNIVRLKSGWETDYKAWSQRDLSAKRYVYWWADGVYFNVRLDEERTCVLVLIGATASFRHRSHCPMTSANAF
jgi:transposase-like protein